MMQGNATEAKTDYKLVQLCLSNHRPGGFFAERLKEYFNASVSNQYFTVMPGDAIPILLPVKCKSCKKIIMIIILDKCPPREMRESRYVWEICQ